MSVPVPRKKALAGLLALLLLFAYACGGDSCDDELLTGSELGADDVVLVEDEPTETPTATEEPKETPTPVESEPTPEPTPEPTVTSTPEPTPDDEPTPTPGPEGEIITILIDTYTWGQSQKTIALQEVLGITADGFYGSGTRAAHLAELENRGLSTAGVPDNPSSPSPTPNPNPNPNPNPTPSTPSPTPTPTPTPGPSVSITHTTNDCIEATFSWTNPGSDPDSWKIGLTVTANVGSSPAIPGGPDGDWWGPAALPVYKEQSLSGNIRTATFTALEFHGPQGNGVWVDLWGSPAPYTVTLSRVDNGVESTAATLTGGIQNDC